MNGKYRTKARNWFESLRDDICAAFEAIEDDPRVRLLTVPPAVSSARPGNAPPNSLVAAAVG